MLLGRAFPLQRISTTQVLLHTNPAQHQHQHHQHQRRQQQHQHHQHQRTRSSSTSTSPSTSSISTSSTSTTKMSSLLLFRDRYARSHGRVALTTAKSQFYHSFARSTRTIFRKGSSGIGKIAILPQFCAIDTHDLIAPAPPAQHQRQHHQQHGKIAILLQFRTIDTHDLPKGFLGHRQNRNFNTVSCDRYARSYERVAPSTAKSQFYYSFVRSIRTILRKGCTQHRKIAILPQFRAIDTHDLTKGFIEQRQNRNFTTVSCDRHARSYERVHRAKAKSQFYYSFVRSTRTIV